MWLAFRFLLCLLGLALAPGVQAATAFPKKPVTIVVAFTPGTSVDIVARFLAQKLGDLWGQSVIVENRAGAGGNIGASFVARSAPDGYVMLLANNSVAISPSLYLKMSYDPLHDLKAVTQISSMPFALVVTPSLPVTTLQDFIAMVKASPGRFNFGSGGVGNTDHMAAEYFTHMAGLQMTHIPYKGGTEAMTDVMSGRDAMYFAGVAAALPLVSGGKLKVLATSGASRSAALPDVPTFVESGLPDYKVVLWNGMMVPAGTPSDVIEKISADLNKVLQMPDVKSRFAQLGLEIEPSSPQKFEAFFNAEAERWAGVIKATGIPKQ